MGRRPPTKISPKSRRSRVATEGVTAERTIASTPREGIQKVALGERQLTVNDLHGLLAEHLLGADEHARQLGDHRNVLLRMVTEDAVKKGPADLIAALDAISRLDNLERSSLSELRKTIELLWRMSGPRRPPVQILEARPTAERVSLGRA